MKFLTKKAQNFLLAPRSANELNAILPRAPHYSYRNAFACGGDVGGLPPERGAFR